MSRQKTFDVVYRTTDAGVVASVFGRPDLAAAEDDREGAKERLVALLRHEIEASGRDVSGADKSGVPEVTTVELAVAVQDEGRYYDVETELTALLRPGADEAGEIEVELPDLALTFTVDAPDQLERASRESFRQQVPSYARFRSLVGIAGREGPAVDLERISLDVELAESAERGGASMLRQVGEPLHEDLDRKDAPGAFGRDDVVAALIDTLADERQRSAVLVGPAGVGKSAVVYEAVARLIANNRNGSEPIPERLEDTPVWRVGGGRLTAGTRFFGEWQDRVIQVIETLEADGGVLFVEDFVELLMATGADDETQGIVGLLQPSIASGRLSLVTELRPEQLGLVKERFPNFLQMLRKIRIDAMDGAQTDGVLERVSYRLGRQHGVRLADETRQRIISLVERFHGVAELPGPAVELAERMARTHHERGVETDEGPRPLLQPEHAVESMASETGLPAELLDPNTDFDAGDVEQFFEDSVFAQPEATDAMTSLVTVIRAGLEPPERPLGSYLFIGPTGVGKTQTALTLARYLFGSEDRLMRFDMSEYQDRWSAARLVGRAKGEAGQLARRVREEPFQVILLDEIEKAHETVFDILLQVLGEGRLTDALGQTVSFANAVVVMTSNLGAGGPGSVGFAKSGSGPGADGERRQRIKQHYVSAVESFFRPEFVGRVDHVVPFRTLGDDTAGRLVRRALEEAFSREGFARREITVDVGEAVVEYLVELGFDERYGARPLKQAVESEVTPLLADLLAGRSDLAGATLCLEMDDGELVVRAE